MAALPDTEELFAVTTPGLERALEAEARAVAPEVRPVAGGVELRGPAGLHRAANLQLRSASKVLLRVAQVEERSLGTVSLAPYRDAARVVEVQAPHGRLVDAARRAWKLPPLPDKRRVAIEPEPTELVVQLRPEGSRVTVSVDTSGALLYRRGYRQEVSRAPMRETLAAGILLYAGYDGSVPLWDPLCGSGTLPIEAALIARRRAPGLERGFAFERFPGLDAAAWAREKEAARALVRAPPAPIWASDLNAGSLGVARRNARRAEVLESLTLERMDATRMKRPPQLGNGPGLVVANFPYGKRVGERSELEALFRAVGRAMKAELPGWRFAFLVAEEDADGLKLETETVLPIDNGGISCALLLGTLA
jgi:putative N6-adenine-specific DNA methylase